MLMEHFCGRSSGGWKRERPCVGIPKRNQHLYDNSVPTVIRYRQKAPMLTLVMAKGECAEGIREVTGMEIGIKTAERYC